MGFCTIQDVKSKMPRAFISSNLPNNIQDSDILEWIDNRSSIIYAKLLNRGIDVGPAYITTTWLTGHAYSFGDMVLDPNGNIQRVSVAGTSGGSQPAWNATVSGTTTDNAVTWVNLGQERLSLLGLTPTQIPLAANFLRSLNLAGAAADVADVLEANVTLQPGEVSMAAVKQKYFWQMIEEINKGRWDSIFKNPSRIVGTAGADTVIGQTPRDRGESTLLGKFNPY
jgi:hypothetical protein